MALAAALAAGTPSLVAATRGYSAAPFQPGEVLHYKVKWGIFRLGTMELVQEPPDSSGNARCAISLSGQSARGMPFVHFHTVDRALLDPHDPRNWVFSTESAGDSGGRTFYRSDSSADEMSIVEVEGERVVRAERLPHTGPLYDALGLLMLIRGMSGSGEEIEAQMVVGRKVSSTRLRFTDEVKEVKSEAFPEPVRVRRFDGQGEWTCKSCAGMTGHFEGWVTDDSSAVPVEVSLKIAVGSVVVKLESCSRSCRPAGPASADPAVVHAGN